MAYAVDSRANSEASVLRKELDTTERQIVSATAETIEEFLLRLDKIEERILAFKEANIDVRPEEGRWQGILSRLSTKPGELVRKVGSGQFPRLRRKYPTAENFWWYLDQEAGRRQRQAIKRLVTTIAIVVGVVVGGYWTINTLFPPNPDTILVVESTGEIEQRILEEDWAGALEIAQAGLQILPDEPELLLWQAVLAEQLEDADLFNESIEQASVTLSDRLELMWIYIGNRRIQVGNLEGAQAAAETALELNPDEPQGTFLLGSVAEFQGDFVKAVDLFDKTFLQAEDDNPQLAVIAKVRMGQLMQSPTFGMATAEPTENEAGNQNNGESQPAEEGSSE
ncbi:MAG: tetratricopeptide repeat protein [Chloroflexota bacterium]